MSSVFMNQFLKMNIDENAPILHTRLTSMPEGTNHLDDFCVLHQILLTDLASKNGGIAYSICDTRLLQPFSFDLLINYYFRFVNKSKETFHCHKIFLLPRLGCSVDINEILKITNNSLIYFFDSMEEAKKYVHDDWMIYNKSFHKRAFSK